MEKNFPGISELLDEPTRLKLEKLPASTLPAGSVLFRPGDEALGFVLVRAGRVGVYLTGRSGREILLYTVETGETCVQTTLGILGGRNYTGEAVAETVVEMVVVPRALFLELMEGSQAFRRFVFAAFADRMADVTHVLEQVAFVRIEQRLAGLLLQRAGEGDTVPLTHQQIATAIGSAREVVSRRLESLQSKGLVAIDRGAIRVSDRQGLERIVAE